MHAVQACWLRHSLAAHVSGATPAQGDTPEKMLVASPFPHLPANEAEDSVANGLRWLKELRCHCCLSSVLLPCLLTEPLCLEGFYLNDPFNLGYISSTHSQTHMDFMGQDMPF